MITVRDLGFRNFLTKKGTSEVIGNNTEKCIVAKAIPFDQFMLSKEPGRNSRNVPFSGHQILTGIQNRVRERMQQETSFGQVFVYRDTMSHPGFVSRMTPETAGNSLLLPTTDISNLCFERFIGTIDLLGNSDVNMRLAVKYEEDKFEMAMGVNVRICENFNIFGGKHKTTQRGITYNDLMDDLDGWLGNIEEQFQTDLQTIAALASKSINKENIHKILGEMMELYWQNKPIMPLTDISALTQKIVEKKNIHTMWDLTNAGTEVIRFDNSAGNSVLDNIGKWNNYLIDKSLSMTKVAELHSKKVNEKDLTIAAVEEMVPSAKKDPDFAD